MMTSMRASIRRIDLTQSPATVAVWPSINWMCADHLEPEPGAASMEPQKLSGPRGPNGLWSAMASAVALAREASTPSREHSTPPREVADSTKDAKVIDLASEAPHLAYLARVACDADHEDAADAEVIVFENYRRLA
jgi:hypothetical protein